MSYDSWEAFREIRREEAKVRAEAMFRRHEAELSIAATDDERKHILEQQSKEIQKAFDQAHKEADFSQWAPVYGAIGSALVAAAIWAASSIPNIWEKLPKIFEYPSARISAGALVAVLGYGFFILRMRARFYYACLELGVACVTAIRSAYELVNSQDRYAYVLAILGSVYIAVRAFDNFDKWKEGKIKKLTSN